MRGERDGLLVVDKARGTTSLEVVKEVKRRLGVKKAGHIGTLDPFATGVLPIVINEGTKLVPFLDEGPKEYDATLKLGEETTTDDLSGKVVAARPWEKVSPEKIEAVFWSFLGKIRQIPPMYSAVKVSGTPLYQWARKGIEVERKEKEVEILDLRVVGVELPQIHFRVSCSKGTYIRTLARDIGRKIGCGAHLLCLRRIRSGRFTLEHAVPWERLNELSADGGPLPWLVPLKEALSGLPEVMGDERLVEKIRFGQGMTVRDLSYQAFQSFEEGQWVKMSSPREDLVAILRSEIKFEEIHRTKPETVAFRPVRVFRFTPLSPKRKDEGKL